MFKISILAVAFMSTPMEVDLVNRFDQLQLDNGLFLDRASDRSTVSSAATGLGSFALAHAATRGLRDPREVSERLYNAFHTTVNANPVQNRGWLSHFTDAEATPKSYSEVSTIDTALFYLGMERAAELLGEEDLLAEIRAARNQIDVDYVLRNGQFLHGFYWPDDDAPAESRKPVFIRHRWNDSSEGFVIYKLFGLDFQFEVRRIDYPLFVYLYPLMFFEDETYVALLGEALQFQIQEYGYSGVTATDGPKGYTIYDQNLISPLLLSAVGSRFPSALETIEKYSLDPAVAAYYIPSGWVTTDDLTIDLASAYVLLVKWKAFDAVTEVTESTNPAVLRIAQQTAD
ncbi:hypothetical protein [Rubinisphaera margarita]|uniref:hypothetical protein n=1 Tax=Rubinisphaera margarita TaxID=2909586 RepID=UPI001EE849F5|nr:hypothetical protein [Rubinisphaera margarita]MCG6157975.1 hypothetical protein [Rubinisphaera margarita]